jgi:hypothetical protein
MVDSLQFIEATQKNGFASLYYTAFSLNHEIYFNSRQIKISVPASLGNVLRFKCKDRPVHTVAKIL